jgi:hypothetical protein
MSRELMGFGIKLKMHAYAIRALQKLLGFTQTNQKSHA